MKIKGSLTAVFAGVATAIALFGNAMTLAPAPAETFVEPVTQLAQASTVDQNTYRHPRLASGSTEPVGVQLVLAMDTSGSMNNEEFEIELTATALALNSELVRNAIKYKGGDNSIAVALIDFDTFAQVRVPWVDIRGDDISDKPCEADNPYEDDSCDTLDKLAFDIANLPRHRSGGTFISEAMELAGKLFLAAPWTVTEKRVLDLFGDGSSSSFEIKREREKLAALGVTINGFAIVNDEPTLDRFFREHLVTREFVESPDGIYSEYGRVWAVARNTPVNRENAAGLTAYFNDVTEGMKQKISVEVAGVEKYQEILEKLNEDAPIPVPPVYGIDMPRHDFDVP